MKSCSEGGWLVMRRGLVFVEIWGFVSPMKHYVEVSHWGTQIQQFLPLAVEGSARCKHGGLTNLRKSCSWVGISSFSAHLPGPAASPDTAKNFAQMAGKTKTRTQYRELSCKHFPVCTALWWGFLLSANWWEVVDLRTLWSALCRPSLGASRAGCGRSSVKESGQFISYLTF